MEDIISDKKRPVMLSEKSAPAETYLRDKTYLAEHRWRALCLGRMHHALEAAASTAAGASIRQLKIWRDTMRGRHSTTSSSPR